MADQPFDPFAAGAEPVGEPAAAQAPAATAFDPFAAGAEPVDQGFDPTKAGAEPVAAKDVPFFQKAAQAVHAMRATAAGTLAGAEAYLTPSLKGISDQFFGTNYNAPLEKPQPEKEIANYDQQLKAKQDMLAQMPPGHPDAERLNNEVAGLQAGRDQFVQQQAGRQELFNNAYTDLHNTLANIDTNYGMTPDVKQGIPAQIGSAVGSLLPSFIPGIGTEAFLITSGIHKWGETFDKTNGDAAAADRALAADVGKNVLFIAGAHGANSALGTAIEKTAPQAGPLLSFATRAAGAAATNVGINQLMAGGEAAANAPAGERLKAFQDALSTPDGVNTAIAVGLGVMGAKPIDSIKAIARDYQATKTSGLTERPEITQAEAAISRARTVAPKTAQALQDQVDALNERDQAIQRRAQALREAENPALMRARVAGEQAAEAQAGFIGGTFTPEAAPEAAPEVVPPVELPAPREVLAAATENGLTFNGKQENGSLLFTPTDKTGPLKGTTISVPADATPETIAGKVAEATARMQGTPEQRAAAQEIMDRRAAREAAAQAPAVPPVIPQEPIPEPAKPPSKTQVAKEAALTPEEAAAKKEQVTTEVRDEVGKSGVVPGVQELRSRLHNDAAAAKALHAELTKEAADKYPPESLPEGAKEILVKNDLTGDKLPTINENGKLRPRFTNDPNITAQQVDKGLRVYVPDDIMDNDQVNPAIDTTYDKAAGKFYVSGVTSKFGPVERPQPSAKERAAAKAEGRTLPEPNPRISQPGDFEKQYKADKAFKQAQQLVLGGTAEQAAMIQSEKRQVAQEDPVGQALVENGFAADAIPLDETATEVPEGSIEAPRPSQEKPTSAQQTARENIQALKEFGLIPAEGKVGTPNALSTFLNRVAEAVRNPNSFQFLKEADIQPWMRVLARVLRDSGTDFDKLATRIVNQPNSGWVGMYTQDPTDATKGQLQVNVSQGHEGGVVGTVLHELLHHVTVAKTDPSYKRTPVEQKAYEDLHALYDSVSRTLFKARTGRDPVDAKELKNWQTSMAGPKGERGLYGLSNIREFITETLTSPRFMYTLDRLPALKGLEGPTQGNKLQTMLATIRWALKRLFTGTTTPNSTLSQAVDRVLSLAERPVENDRTLRGLPREDLIKRAEEVGYHGPTIAQYPDSMIRTFIQAADRNRAVSVPQLPGEDLGAKRKEPTAPPLQRPPFAERLDLEEEARRQGYDQDTITTMTVPELRDLVGGNTPTIPEAPTTSHIVEDGWIGPDGKFTPAPMTEGGHENVASVMIGNNPQLSEAFTKEMNLRDSNPATIKDQVKSEDIYNFMEKNGYVRVVYGGPGGISYVTGKPTPAQKRLIVDQMKEEGGTLYHDFGPRTRALYTPDQAFSKAGGQGGPVITQTATGHEVNIPDTATRDEMQATLDSLGARTDISDTDKQAISDQLTNALGPTVQLTRGQGKDRITYGSDAVQTLANNYGKEQANRVRLDFGSTTKPTETQRLDESAAPFVVEAGGNKEELLRDYMRILHSKDPNLAEKYAPILEHAIENFDRINKEIEGFKQTMKDQVDREHSVGVETGEIDNYVTRLLDDPNAQDNILPASGGGSTRYFMKGRRFEKLADAIHEGFIPKTTNIVDLAQRRVESGERLVQMKLLEEELRHTLGPDGKPIIGNTEEYESLTGKTVTRTPAGYVTVQTGGRPLTVSQEFAPLFQALYGDSSINKFIDTAASLTGKLKRTILVFDTYHVGRILMKELAYSKGASRLESLAATAKAAVGGGYATKGLSLLEYRPEDLQRAVENGDITQAMADYSNEVLPGTDMTRRQAAQELIQRGLNVGKVADNLRASHAAGIPFAKNFNPWVFDKLSRGAMIQTALENFQRNMQRFPERGVEGNARQTAKEYNEVFGNLQNQGLFKNKAYQDLVRTLVLAPQWAESQLLAEGRGYAQTAKGIGELATGKARLGTVAQGQLTVVLGMLAANQIINYLSTGHSTFQNKGGHILDAFIPGGSRGFWFNPLEIGAEYAHMAMRYFNNNITGLDILTRIASNKLGPAARSLTTAVTGRDYAGRSFATTGDRVRGALSDLIPIPMLGNIALEKDPRQALGLRGNRTPGATEKQLLQSIGMKVEPAQSATSLTFALAHPYRSDRSYTGPIEYKDLRLALDSKDETSVQSELALLASRGKTVKQIESGIGVGTKQKFTDSIPREQAFYKSLTQDQKAQYNEAQQEHLEHVKLLMRNLRAAPEEIKAKLRANLKPQLP